MNRPVLDGSVQAFGVQTACSSQKFAYNDFFSSIQPFFLLIVWGIGAEDLEIAMLRLFVLSEI